MTACHDMNRGSRPKMTVELLVRCPLPPNLNYGQSVWAICGFLPSELSHWEQPRGCRVALPPALPKRRSAGCPGHRTDVDDRRDVGPGGAVCGHGVRYRELGATVGRPEVGQRRAGLPGEGGQLIQDRQLAGPRCRPRVRHAPVLPEQHLGLVQGGEVVDQVVPELGPASGGRDLQARFDNETLRVDRARAGQLPGARGGQEAAGGHVKSVDAGPAGRVGVVVVDLWLDQPPALGRCVPDLGDLVVDQPTVKQVPGEADPGPRWDPLVPGHRNEQHGEIAAATDQPLPGLAGGGQREIGELTKPGEHRCRIPGVDLADPLRPDAIRRPIAIGPEVEHQLLARRAQRAEARREPVDRGCGGPRLCDQALHRPEPVVAHPGRILAGPMTLSAAGAWPRTTHTGNASPVHRISPGPSCSPTSPGRQTPVPAFTVWVPITLSQPLTWYLLLNEALSGQVSGVGRA